MKLKTLVFLLLASFHLSAQEFVITNYYGLPLYLNPAKTGENTNPRLHTGFSIRNQYGYHFQDYFLSYDKKRVISEKDYLGFGALFNYHGHGYVNSNQTNLLLSCAYSRIIHNNSERNHFINVGLNFGGGREAIDDEIPGSHGSTWEIKESKLFPTIGWGLNYTTQSDNGLDFEFGGSVYRLNEPETSYQELGFKSPSQKKLHTRISHDFNEQFSINMNAMYLHVGTEKLFTAGAAFGYRFSNPDIELNLGGDVFYDEDFDSGVHQSAIRFGILTNKISLSAALRFYKDWRPGNIYELIVSYNFGEES